MEGRRKEPGVFVRSQLALKNMLNRRRETMRVGELAPEATLPPYVLRALHGEASGKKNS